MDLFLGEITKDYYNIEFITLDSEFYKEITLDVSEFLDKTDLIQNINKLPVSFDSVYQVKLIGKRNFIIDINDIIKYVKLDNILKFKDDTDTSYSLDILANEHSLKGYFVQELFDRLKNASSEDEQEEIKKAIEIGIKLLTNER